ncbi:hypothetical protein SAMN02745163_03472 [Clostridium cavendishii DSM 21758]|uniref:Uncharacterized protein n=1 Tax=Clostridium cavendishii DSM 21758 TaxID=1121302 RepID=A0A1M6QVW6_9CLOT|nr:hypothetical protein [Clostridium cavendishii]SHK24381.1 hypothetical protein SAMN02745163_03472 [Clostridium cavendishii DSM 21758]
MNNFCYQGADFAIHLNLSVEEGQESANLVFPETRSTLEYGHWQEFLSNQSELINDLLNSLVGDMGKCLDQGLTDFLEAGDNVILEINMVDWNTLTFERTMWKYISEESLNKAMMIINFYFYFVGLVN